MLHFSPCRLRAAVLGTALLLSATGCSFWTTGDECNEARYERELQTLRTRIDREIGEAEASSVEACRALPLGDKPCGGPWTYLVYSAEASDAGGLEALAAEYDRLDRARNRACGLVSDCMLRLPPTPVLVDGRCVADDGGG